MGKTADFVVKYDPQKDTKQDLTDRILYSLFIRRMKANKPVKIFIGGDSGSGKSFAGIKLQEVLCRLQGLDIKDYVDAMNVFIPIEYPRKVDNLLFNKDYKPVNIICIHEARDVIRAKLWQSFVSQSIADINQLSRSIKRLCIIIISQFIRDITKEVRYTLNYYCTVSRGNTGKSKLRINVIWHDDRDLEKPLIKKRRVKGYLVYPDGKYKLFTPQYIELDKPDKEIVDQFEKLDRDAKADILKAKINKLIEEMKKDIGEVEGADKVNSMVDWYSSHLEQIEVIGKHTRKGKLKVSEEFIKMHDLTKEQKKKFEEDFNARLIKMGVYDEAGLQPDGKGA